LKAAVERFKAFECVEQFQTYFAHRLARPGKLFRVLDCEPDSINDDASLIGHLEFNRRAESGWNGVVLAVILGPVVEEVVFRGYLMAAGLQLERRLFRKAGGWASVVSVALVFMFAHGARTGTTGIQLICIMMTGALYGFIRLRLQSTLAPVLAHGSYNLVLFLSSWVGISN
jgi:membrane protease YdiL (CAAX protease family)